MKKGNVQDHSDYIMESLISGKDLVRRQIWISPEQKFDWNNSELFIKQLQTISFRLGFEVTGNSKKIMINFLCHRFDLPIVNAAFQGVFEYCELSDVIDNPLSSLPKKMWQDNCFRDYFPQKPYYKLMTRPPEIKTSPLKPGIIAFSNIEAPAVGWLQVLLQPILKNWKRNIEMLLDIEYAIKLQSGFQIPQRYSQQAPSGDLRHMAMDLESKAHNDKPFYAMAIRVGIVGGGHEGENLLSSISTFVNLFQHGGRPLNYITQDKYKQTLSTDQIRDMFKLGLVYRPGFIVNSWELTGPLNIPSLSANEPRKLPIKVLETLPITNPDLLEGTWIGTCDYAGKQQRLCIPEKPRKRGTHLIGKSGKGKSTTQEHMILHDIIEQGHGVAVLDPHNDLIERLLRLIPEDYVEKTIYFDPGDPDWVPLFNPLEKIIGQDTGRTTNDIVKAIESFVASGGWGDRLENILRNIIYALIDLSNGTLLNVSNLLRNKSENSKRIRKEILNIIDNETVRQFWLHDYEHYAKSELGPPINKLSKLLVSGTPALMLSQPENRFNIRKIMDEGMILLINLSNVELIVRQVLGCFMLSFFHLNALTRSSIPPDERKQFRVHGDEAHLYIADLIENLIVETRKYGVDFNLANQYLSQFSKKKIDALSTIGSSIIFNVNTNDAQYLIKNLQRKVTVEDIVSLEEYSAIVRIEDDIVRIKTRPPQDLPTTNFRDRIIEESRKKYYKPIHEVKKWIRQQGCRPYSPIQPLFFSQGNMPIGETNDLKYDEF